MSKCITFMLKEEMSLVQFGLQMIAVATAETGRRNRAHREQPGSLRSSSSERRDRRNDKHMQIALN